MPEIRGAVDAIERFVKDFSWKRLVVWAGLFGFLAAIASLYEWYTNDFRLTRLSEQIEVLNSLQEASPGAARDTSLVSVYENIRTQVRASVSQGAGIPDVVSNVWHGSLGFLPWAAMSGIAMALPEQQTDENTKWGAAAFLVMGVVAGAFITLLPDSWPTPITHVAIPLGVPALVVTLFSIFGEE